jgi:hypothetical protein
MNLSQGQLRGSCLFSETSHRNILTRPIYQLTSHCYSCSAYLFIHLKDREGPEHMPPQQNIKMTILCSHRKYGCKCVHSMDKEVPDSEPIVAYPNHHFVMSQTYLRDMVCVGCAPTVRDLISLFWRQKCTSTLQENELAREVIARYEIPSPCCVPRKSNILLVRSP